LLLCLRSVEKRWAYAIATGGVLAELTYTDLELLLMGAIVLGGYLAFRLIGGRFIIVGGRIRLAKKEAPWKQWLLPFTISLLVASVLTAPYLLTAATKALARHPSALSDTIKNSANIFGFIVPPDTNPFFSWVGNQYYSTLSGGSPQWIIYVGFVVLAMATLGLLKGRGRWKYYAFSLATLSFFFTLGPGAGWASVPYNLVFSGHSPLQIFRAPARFSILLMLSLAALSGLGLHRFSGLVGRKFGVRAAHLASVLVILLLVIEYLPVVSLQSATAPSWTGTIAQDEGNFAVLVLPPKLGATQLSIYFQTFTDKPLIGGKTSQNSTYIPLSLESLPFFDRILRPRTIGHFQDVFAQPFTDADLSSLVLSRYQIKYIVVFSNQFGNQTLSALADLLTEALGAAIYNDTQYSVFELHQWTSAKSFLSETDSSILMLPGAGWSAPSKGKDLGGNQGAVRHIANDSILQVYADAPALYNLTMTTKQRGLHMCARTLNSTQETTICTSTDSQGAIQFAGLQLASGWNDVQITLKAATAAVTSVRFVQP